MALAHLAGSSPSTSFWAPRADTGTGTRAPAHLQCPTHHIVTPVHCNCHPTPRVKSLIQDRPACGGQQTGALPAGRRLNRRHLVARATYVPHAGSLHSQWR
jgi:hypothetical protein